MSIATYALYRGKSIYSPIKYIQIPYDTKYISIYLLLCCVYSFHMLFRGHEEYSAGGLLYAHERIPWVCLVGHDADREIECMDTDLAELSSLPCERSFSVYSTLCRPVHAPSTVALQNIESIGLLRLEVYGVGAFQDIFGMIGRVDSYGDLST